MTTLTDIKRRFETLHVTQCGAKQLYVVNGDTLVSYQTIVGKKINDTWYLTRNKYSVTTTRQINWFASKTKYPIIWHNEELEQTLTGSGWQCKRCNQLNLDQSKFCIACKEER